MLSLGQTFYVIWHPSNKFQILGSVPRLTRLEDLTEIDVQRYPPLYLCQTPDDLLCQLLNKRNDNSHKLLSENDKIILC